MHYFEFFSFVFSVFDEGTGNLGLDECQQRRWFP
jgi:hypothetical protein